MIPLCSTARQPALSASPTTSTPKAPAQTTPTRTHRLLAPQRNKPLVKQEFQPVFLTAKNQPRLPGDGPGLDTRAKFEASPHRADHRRLPIEPGKAAKPVHSFDPRAVRAKQIL